MPVLSRRSLALLAVLTTSAVSASAQQPTLALAGGRVIDGFGGPILENGVVLVSGERIVAVGPASEIAIPDGIEIIDTNGMTVLPGLCDMHVHLQLLGHGDYERWDDLYGTRDEEIMAIAAAQLLSSGVTCARDLGGPLDELVATKRKIADGEIPGPRLFISGPFLQRAPYEPWQAEYRWGVNGAADAEAKTRELLDAGVDVIKLIDQDQLTDEEVSAIVSTAHAAGKPVVAHGHRMDEIRVGLKHGVDNFEHTGLGTAPGYAPDVLQLLFSESLLQIPGDRYRFWQEHRDVQHAAGSATRAAGNPGHLRRDTKPQQISLRRNSQQVRATGYVRSVPAGANQRPEYSADLASVCGRVKQFRHVISRQGMAPQAQTSHKYTL